MMKLDERGVQVLCLGIAEKLSRMSNTFTKKVPKCFPIPNAGYNAAREFGKCHPIDIVLEPGKADFFLDDIVDSGATRERWIEAYPGIPFVSLIDKTDPKSRFANEWVVFPWEGTKEKGIVDNITRIIQYTGDDAKREGLQETPMRVAKALNHWFSGYDKDAKDILKVFEDGGETYDEMVVVKDIPIYSKCEHHMADIFGTATIAYIPDGKIVGLSKLSRLADMYARRLQVQERLTQQIADSLWDNLHPVGVGVMIRARHMCMESRGICQQGHHTITTALRGAIKSEPESRAEFLAMARG